MRGIVITTDDKYFVHDFEEPVVESIGDALEGYPEPVYPVILKGTDYTMFVDDDGRRKRLPINTLASILYGFPMNTPILGDVVIINQKFSHAQGMYVLKDLTDEDIDRLATLFADKMPTIEHSKDEYAQA